MDIAEWIVNFIAFGMGLTLTTLGLFGIMMIATLVIDGYNKIKN
tara:strand:+ start:259 stop:390 length:132 start_codon:yes stop_codon:yes gene_type:complete